MKKQLLLNRNEILQGPAPAVSVALRNFDITKAPLYFEGYHGSALVPVLAKKFKIPRDRVSVGYGIEFFLRAIFDGLDAQKESVLVQDPHFTYYPYYLRAKGVRIASFKLIDLGNEFAFDVSGCIEQIRRERPKVILITSPNNPTGNVISAKDFGKILAASDRRSLVILDEAYHGFSNDHDEKAFLSLLGRHPNMVILRSFSKEYALAGVRIAYALWGAEAKGLARYEDLYLGSSRLLDEVAIAALGAKGYYAKLKKTIIAERSALAISVNRMKHFRAYESKANFVFVKVDAKAVHILKQRMSTLTVAVAKFVTADGMRVSIGLAKHMKSFSEMLGAVDRMLS